MKTTDLQAAAHALPKGRIRRVRHALGTRVEVLDGCLWLTLDNDPRDLVVTPGHGVVIDRDADVLLSAMADSHFVLLAPIAAAGADAAH